MSYNLLSIIIYFVAQIIPDLVCMLPFHHVPIILCLFILAFLYLMAQDIPGSFWTFMFQSKELQLLLFSSSLNTQ